jgi:two-component system chemotaxis sensor kinase CheA
MAFSAGTLSALDDLQSRLASEFMFAQPGRDDGMIPIFSLLGDLAQVAEGNPEFTDPIQRVRHQMEARLDAAQPFDAPTLTAVRALLDWVTLAIGEIRQGRAVPPPAPPTPATPQAGAPGGSAPLTSGPDVLLELNLDENRELLAEFHAEALDHLQQIEAALLALDQTPDEPEALNAIFRSFHTIKGNAGFLHLTPMRTLAHEVESLLDLARTHKLRLNSEAITQILLSRDALQTMVGQITLALETGRAPDRIIPISQLIAAVNRCARAAPPVEGSTPAAPLAPGAPASLAPVVPIELSAAAGTTPSVSTPPSGAEPAETSVPRAASSSTVRVYTEKLDSLMDVVGELVIVQSQIVESSKGGGGNHALQRDLGQLARITKELQHTAMSLRMIPIKPTFQKMERLARDLARTSGKKVVFAVTGEDTELDRTVVEEIGDPLVHMVRNALDHGIESPADRVAKGKPECGTLHLRAYHEGSYIVVEMIDDGRGINPDKILAKARQLQLVPADAQLARDEVLNLIFAPGFSTAERVTAVSGRGVGMDVVRRNIEHLRGKIEIQTEVDRGSTFRIKLPLTLAIIDGLVIRVGKDRFILPATSVRMALRPDPEALVTVHGRAEALDLRGKILPLYRLHRQFSIPGAVERPSDGIVVVVEVSGKQRALLVDEMLSKQEVVIKNLGAFMRRIPGVSGGAILGDGNIALILDPFSLFQAA